MAEVIKSRTAENDDFLKDKTKLTEKFCKTMGIADF